MPPREIPTRRGVSVKTIEIHRETIKRRLELASGAELVTSVRGAD